MQESIRREIEALHAFFEDWFCGRVADSDEVFSRCLGVLAPGFRLVTPSGAIRTRAEIAAEIRAAHGSRVEEEPPFRIWIEHFECRPLADGTWLALYEEWHARGSHGRQERRGRQSSAIFAADAAAPHGVTWEHVHETLLPR